MVNSQTVQFKSIFICGTTPFHIEEKIELYQINIYILSFNTAPIQHDIGKNKLFNFPKLQASNLMTVPVFELPGTTSNMYFVHVNLINSIENTKIQKCIKDRLDLL